MQRILIVEDDWELNTGLAYMLEKEGFELPAPTLSGKGKNDIGTGERIWCFWM